VPERPSGDPQPSEGFVAVGFVRGARGTRGELKVDPLTDFPERFRRGATVWLEGRAYKIRLSRQLPPSLLLQLEGIDTREAAAALGGRLLEVPEEQLAELEAGEYYRFEIVGLDVVDSDGAQLGRVEEVLETGANDVYVVRNDEGDLLLPAIDTVVKEIDVEGGRMVVELIEGLERRPHTPQRSVRLKPDPRKKR
jgi:16S rRNA processing protein RimM